MQCPFCYPELDPDQQIAGKGIRHWIKQPENKRRGYHINPMCEKEAAIVSQWRYNDPYSFYNMGNDPETIQELLDGSYYSVFDQQNELSGYFCFGQNAQVPGGRAQGLYEDKESLDIGLGLCPNLTGKGMGRCFLNAGLDFATKKFHRKTFRLSVATFNRRAIFVYEKAGFKPVQTFMSKTKHNEDEFLLMVK
jgi:ribosomal-protein-alanine N-acetyltransferase